jgi:hypothetical protein
MVAGVTDLQRYIGGPEACMDMRKEVLVVRLIALGIFGTRGVHFWRSARQRVSGSTPT